MIQLKTLNKKQLTEFVLSGDFEKYSFLPITSYRAFSHIKNPKAEESQTLLILAFENEELAGYLGCFPDKLKTGGKIYDFAWLSTLYVSNRFRGKKIAQKLLDKAFKEYDSKIAITEFTKEAESLYNKIGVFKYVKPKIGKRFYIKTNLSTIIPLKRPNTKSLKPLFSISDGILNSIISIKNITIKKPDFKYEIISQPDEESIKFMNRFPCHRTAKDIKWIIENPWVLESNKTDERYLFSSFSKIFKYFWVKIYNKNNDLICCSLLLLRNGHLKISYLFTQDDLKKFVDLLSWFIVKHHVIVVTSYQTALNKAIEKTKNFPKIHERDLERRYMFHKQFIKDLPENFQPDFQDGDGDCVMT